MAAASPAIQEDFHGPGIQATLRAYDRDYCTFDLECDASWPTWKVPAVVVEVLLQPFDPETRLPVGGPLVLVRDPVELTRSADGRRALGRSWLPGIDPATARDCYYRVLPTNKLPVAA